MRRGAPLGASTLLVLETAKRRAKRQSSSEQSPQYWESDDEDFEEEYWEERRERAEEKERQGQVNCSEGAQAAVQRDDDENTEQEGRQRAGAAGEEGQEDDGGMGEVEIATRSGEEADTENSEIDSKENKRERWRAVRRKQQLRKYVEAISSMREMARAVVPGAMTRSEGSLANLPREAAGLSLHV